MLATKSALFVELLSELSHEPKGRNRVGGSQKWIVLPQVQERAAIFLLDECRRYESIILLHLLKEAQLELDDLVGRVHSLREFQIFQLDCLLRKEQSLIGKILDLLKRLDQTAVPGRLADATTSVLLIPYSEQISAEENCQLGGLLSHMRDQHAGAVLTTIWRAQEADGQLADCEGPELLHFVAALLRHAVALYS